MDEIEGVVLYVGSFVVSYYISWIKSLIRWRVGWWDWGKCEDCVVWCVLMIYKNYGLFVIGDDFGCCGWVYDVIYKKYGEL